MLGCCSCWPTSIDSQRYPSIIVFGGRSIKIYADHYHNYELNVNMFNDNLEYYWENDDVLGEKYLPIDSHTVRSERNFRRIPPS